VADALSRKHHCNNLMIQSLTSCCDPNEPSLHVIPHGALTNIALIPTIKDEVIVVQKTNVGMGHIRRRLRLGEAKCFHEDVRGVLKDRRKRPGDELGLYPKIDPTLLSSNSAMTI
jgi:hypothetical protein